MPTRYTVRPPPITRARLGFPGMIAAFRDLVRAWQRSSTPAHDPCAPVQTRLLAQNGYPDVTTMAQAHPLLHFFNQNALDFPSPDTNILSWISLGAFPLTSWSKFVYSHVRWMVGGFFWGGG